MAHNYASDSTFQDVMARLAGTDAPFSAVWPTLKGPILSGRALTVAEYRPLNALISEAHASRIARNEALNEPHVHSTKGDVANSVGVTDEAEPAITPTSPTAIPASHVDTIQKAVGAAASESSGIESGKADATPPAGKASSETATPPDAGTADEKPEKETEK